MYNYTVYLINMATQKELKVLYKIFAEYGYTETETAELMIKLVTAKRLKESGINIKGVDLLIADTFVDYILKEAVK